MPTYERSVRVNAPFEEVWDFHSTEEGLVALTPGWMNIRIDAVRGPDGEPDPEVLEAGSVVESSVRPFGVGPRQSWNSHMFDADDGETVVRDRVEYALPFGALGDALGPFARLGLAPMFRYRHRRTRDLLEG